MHIIQQFTLNFAVAQNIQYFINEHLGESLTGRKCGAYSTIAHKIWDKSHNLKQHGRKAFVAFLRGYIFFSFFFSFFFSKFKRIICTITRLPTVKECDVRNTL